MRSRFDIASMSVSRKSLDLLPARREVRREGATGSRFLSNPAAVPSMLHVVSRRAVVDWETADREGRLVPWVSAKAVTNWKELARELAKGLLASQAASHCFWSLLQLNISVR